jgi:hypothetical protein
MTDINPCAPPPRTVRGATRARRGEAPPGRDFSIAAVLDEAPAAGRKRCFSVCVLLLSWLSGTCTAEPAAPALTPLEYSVLSQVIGHGLPPETTAIVIGDRTTGDPHSLVPADADLEALAKRLDTTPGLLAGWAGLNQQQSPLEKKLALTASYELLPEALRAKIFAGEDPTAGWARFHKRFPKAPGLLRVSRVAIDDTEQSALVYVEFACGPECGTGRLIRLARAGDRWQVQSGELVWVAGS